MTLHMTNNHELEDSFNLCSLSVGGGGGPFLKNTLPLSGRLHIMPISQSTHQNSSPLGWSKKTFKAVISTVALKVAQQQTQ